MHAQVPLQRKLGAEPLRAFAARERARVRVDGAHVFLVYGPRFESGAANLAEEGAHVGVTRRVLGKVGLVSHRGQR